jgi:hypothetical protein
VTAHLFQPQPTPGNGRSVLAATQPKEGNVYVVPLIALALIAVIAAVWSPIFALLIAVPAFVLFLAFVGLSRRADQKAPRPSGAPVSGEGAPSGGIWDEKNNS